MSNTYFVHQTTYLTFYMLFISTPVGASIILVLLIGSWWWIFLKRKKRKIFRFPDAWYTILTNKVAFYRQLSMSERARFEENVLQFLNDIPITGVSVEVDDTDRLLVAASAVIPLFGFPGWRFRNLNEVLLYEGTFNEDYETQKGEDINTLGMVGTGSMNRMMILSKSALHQGFDDNISIQNVGIHEFVHLLDKADGTTDGIPELLISQSFLIPWVKMMHKEIEAIKDGVSDIPFYGSTNEAEFLSVVSEYFFQNPKQLEIKHPELYALLEKAFRHAPK
ncbi:MAG: M90 family metallopeptidase [Saprospiraceae bacterium]